MRVLPLPIPPGPDCLGSLDVLLRALSGEGPLLVPHAPGERPDLPAQSDGPGAIAVGTSGSTGTPKRAVLPAEALRASAHATHEVLGGPGCWLLALPPHHIAGLQVLLRSAAAGFTPEVLDAPTGFGADVFCRAAAAMPPAPRRYVSLVPTQLHRILADPAATRALAGFDAVLVGGAASAARLLTAARHFGVRVVTTYGMSETAGGCVYDGVPLPVSRVRLDGDGRISLGGATLASGYLGGADGHPADDPFTTGPDGERWFRTDDLGHLEANPGDDARRLVVDGRADDVVVTGGLKVRPGVVEAALHEVLPPGCSAVVVGVPDPEWGQVVGAVLTPSDDAPAAAEAQGASTAAAACAALEAAWPRLRDDLRTRLPGPALPRRVAVVPELPLRGPGKPDRAALRALLGSRPSR